MKHLRWVPTTAALIACVAWQAHAAGAKVKVIANPSVKTDSISADELKSVFLEDSDTLAGSHVEPVLARGGPAHDAFLKNYLWKNDSAITSHALPKIISRKTWEVI